MWPKMYLSPEEWVQITDGYAKGKRYNGSVSLGYSRPEGMGILKIKKDLYQVGEFDNGQLCGRGLMLQRKEWMEDVTFTTRGTYEEVMATAEFDSCGRVISCQPVTHTHTQKEKRERWIISQDGIWSNGEFRNETPKNILNSEWWKEAQIGFMHIQTYDNHPSTDARYRSKALSAMDDEHMLELEGHLLLTVYDNLSLLAFAHGLPFRLDVGKEFVLPSQNYPGSITEYHYTFSLGKNYKKYIDLQLQEWQKKRMIRPAVMVAEHLYTRSLNSLIFLCEHEYKPTPKAYAEAIIARVPEAKIIEDRPDGTVVVALPDDEWTICAQRDHSWIYSAKAKDRLRLTNRKPEEIANVAAQAQEIWQYIQKSL